MQYRTPRGRVARPAGSIGRRSAGWSNATGTSALLSNAALATSDAGRPSSARRRSCSEWPPGWSGRRPAAQADLGHAHRPTLVLSLVRRSNGSGAVLPWARALHRHRRDDREPV